jgi:nucleoside-diphosphate-sugar epimerase
MVHTLITGANSFVAAHIIEKLIHSGHTVTGVVRRTSSGKEILALHPEWEPHFDFVVIKDYSAAGAWDEVFRQSELDHVVHVAAPMAVGTVDYDRDVLSVSVQG